MQSSRFYIEHPNKGVRKSAISTLHRAYATSIICAIVEESGKMEKWSPGLPLQLQATVRDRGKEVLMMVTVKTWIEEEDRFVNNQLLSPYLGKVIFAAAEHVFSIHFYDDAVIEFNISPALIISMLVPLLAGIK
jgi:hypothetical protein